MKYPRNDICSLSYHQAKANVVANALSQKLRGFGINIVIEEWMTSMTVSEFQIQRSWTITGEECLR